MTFDTRRINPQPDVIAPDGSEVRVLCGLARGGLATFTLAPQAVAKAIRHRTVDELWYVVAGNGRMWRRLGEHEEITPLCPGISLTIPVGTSFQFRCDGDQTLVAVAATMPSWPGEAEAVIVEGPWAPAG